jgi:hypothetical protein
MEEVRMKVQPVALSFKREPTEEEIANLNRYIRNVIGVMESIVIKTIPLNPAIGLRDTMTRWQDDPELSKVIGSVGGITRNVNRNSMVWWDVWNTLNQTGHDPKDNIFFVVLLDSDDDDGSGVGMPYGPRGAIRWDGDADPLAGGLAVVGRRCITRIPSARSITWTREDRRGYMIDIDIGCHELGHALGCHHTYGDPTGNKHLSIMGYGYQMWLDGSEGDEWAESRMCTGAELRTWRAHSIMRDLPESAYIGARLVYSGTANLVIRGKIPPAQGLLMGRTYEEWARDPRGHG